MREHTAISMVIAVGGLYSIATCALVPTRATECSLDHGCPEGKMCDLDRSVCLPLGGNQDGNVLLDGGLDASVSCSREAQCTPGQACRVNQCVPCVQHSDCSSLICEQAINMQGQSGCLPPSMVVYVYNQAPNCQQGDGTLLHPVCSITNGLNMLRSDQTAVRVLASTQDYQEQLNLSGRVVSIYGADDGVGTARLSYSSGPAVLLGRAAVTARVLLDSFEIQSSAKGVYCNGDPVQKPVLALRRGQIYGTQGFSIETYACELTVERTVLRENRIGALYMGLDTSYSIRNTYIINNGNVNSIYAAVVIDESMGIFEYNTLVGNRASPKQAGGVNCGSGAPVAIRNSIVFNDPSITQAPSQFAGACNLVSVVVHPQDQILDAGSISILRAAPVFVPDAMGILRLANDPANNACCVDKGQAEIPTRKVEDFFGTVRPLGLAPDVGAHELR